MSPDTGAPDTCVHFCKPSSKIELTFFYFHAITEIPSLPAFYARLFRNLLLKISTGLVGEGIQSRFRTLNFIKIGDAEFG